MNAFPCVVCAKRVYDWNKALACDICNEWVHIKCNNLDDKDYRYHVNHPYAPFTCIKCIINYIPFSKLDNNQFNISIKQGVNYIEEVELISIPNERDQRLYNRINRVMYNNIHNINDHNIDDENEPENNMNCKYYSIDEFKGAKLNSDKTFSILHLNIHSIELHIPELRIILAMLNFEFDILCISESKIQEGVEPKVNIQIEGYQEPEGTHTVSEKGGVLIYVKKGINYKPRPDLKIYSPKELESFFIEIINTNEKNTIVGVIYKHPSMDSNIFIKDYLQNLVQKLNNENKNKFIAGDFNFDLLQASNRNDISDFLECMMIHLLLPTITIPTRINPVNNTLIDNIFTNDINPDIVSGNFTIGISDHLPSFIAIPRLNQNHIPKKHNIMKRNMKNFDRQNFILDYLSTDWDELIEIEKNDVNYSLSKFFHKTNELLDKYVPNKKVSHREFKRKYKPWITDEVLTKIKNKNKTFKQFVKCKDVNQKNIIHESYKRIKNEITFLIRNNKKKYYDDYFTKHKRDLKKTWQGIKDIINIKNKNIDQPTCIIHDNINITDPEQIANNFNEFYTSIADNILNKRKYEGNRHFNDFLQIPSFNTMFLYECDEVEIQSLIRSLHPRKAYGPNSIPTEILQLLVNDISKPLSKIFNLSFLTGEYPDLLKLAKTIPVFKKGSRLHVANYRPISLLSNVNKLLEKLMFSRVYKFLEKFNLIYELQFGFRSKHSTNLALIDITEKIRQALDNKSFACGIFVDLQKAFDTVNHEILIQKLSHYGIRGLANKWFSSYLHNRSQYVSILGFESEMKNVKHGVPQGSVLGPLLFLLYINDCIMLLNSSKFFTLLMTQIC